MKRIIDAKGAILGRMASTVAKAALLGDDIEVVNCEAAIISGNKYSLKRKWLGRKDMGQPVHGPFFPRMPDRFVRRVVRGMLPHKNTRGKEAFERVQCHIGLPAEFTGKALERIAEAELSRFKGTKYITVRDICAFMGGKV